MEELRSCLDSSVRDRMAKTSQSIIVVAGLASGTGKTSVAEGMIDILRPQGTVGAVKVTVTHGVGGCPHGGRTCNVCAASGQDFDIITRPSVVKQPDTDTGRFYMRGADPVLWLITRRAFALQGWAQLKYSLQNVDSVVVESNTLANIVGADLLLMVADPSAEPSRWKDSARALLASADVVVVNERGSDEQRLNFFRELTRLRARRAPIVHVGHPSDIKQDRVIRELLHCRNVLRGRHADPSCVT